MYDHDSGVSTVDREGMRVTFYMAAKHHPRRSEEEGRPIFVSIPYVKIEAPGDRYSHFDGKATLEHKSRWPELWAAFERGQQGIMLEEGDMPLEHWAALDRTRVLELKAMGVHSIKQLAAVPDGTLQKLGLTTRKERDMAQLQLMERSDAEKAMAKRMAELEATVSNLQGQLAQAVNMPAADKKSAA